jgi:Iron-containing alcohol dehydrogenase
MTLIRYLTRTHFAEAAIEDALPEVVGRLSRALVLVDDEQGTEAALQRVREVLSDISLQVVTSRPLTPRRDTVERIYTELKQAETTTLIAIGGAAAIGQGRLVADHAARKSDPIVVIAVPVRLFDLGLARQVRLPKLWPSAPCARLMPAMCWLALPEICQAPCRVGVAIAIVLQGAVRRLIWRVACGLQSGLMAM